jgi:hypothetical protein
MRLQLQRLHINFKEHLKIACWFLNLHARVSGINPFKTITNKFMSRFAMVFTTFLLLQMSSVKAQQFRVGLRSGYLFTTTTVTKDNITTRYNKNSVLGGVHLQYQAAKKLALRLGLEYLTRGGYENYAQDYLDFPLNVIYQLPVQKNKFLFGTGPVLCVNVSNYAPFYFETKKTDVGINDFTGYEWAIGFSFNLNYTQGLTNIMQDKTYFTDYKNRYTGLTVGYLF